MYLIGYCKDYIMPLAQCLLPGQDLVIWSHQDLSVPSLCPCITISTGILPLWNKNTVLDPHLPSDFLCHKTGTLLGSSRFRWMLHLLISKVRALAKLLAECLITFYSLLASNYSKLFLNEILSTGKWM